MNLTRYILPVISIAIPFVANAQKSDSLLSRSVTVEREYKPVIRDAGKINSVPKVLEPQGSKPILSYSNFNLPMNTEFSIHPLAAAEPEKQNLSTLRNGYARVGLGNYMNTLADLAYPLLNNESTRLDFSLNHLGTSGSKTHNSTNAALSLDQYFDNSILYAGLGGGYEYLKYYGSKFDSRGKVVALDTVAHRWAPAGYLESEFTAINRSASTFSIGHLASDSTTNAFWRFHAFMGIRSRNNNDLAYNGQIRFQSFDMRNGATEYMLRTLCSISSPYNDNRFGVDFELYNIWYGGIPTGTSVNFYNAYNTARINPYYRIKGENADISLGVISGISMGHEKKISPAADIHAEWRPSPSYIALYAGLTGGYDVNTMDNMFRENRYLYNDVRVNDTYTPVELYVGMKVKPAYNILVDAFIDYKYIDNQYFFVNKAYKSASVTNADSLLFTNKFNVLYSDASLIRVGTNITYDYKNKFDLKFRAVYNGWTVNGQDYAWNKPRWQTAINANYKLDHNLSFSADIFMDGSRYAKLGNMAIKMKSKNDINLGASYSYNEWLTAFVKLNNILNSGYQDYYGYDVQKLNFMLGAAFSF